MSSCEESSKVLLRSSTALSSSSAASCLLADALPRLEGYELSFAEQPDLWSVSLQRIYSFSSEMEIRFPPPIGGVPIH